MRRSSGDFSALHLRVPSPKVSPEHRSSRCRSGDFSAVNVLCSPRVSPQHHPEPSQQQRLRGHLDRLQWLSHPPFNSTKEGEDDSGYHTGNSGSLGKRQPGQRTLTRDEYRRRIAAFNTNNYGLVMEPPTEECDTFTGFIRVHMNLIRPINMCISVPPNEVADLNTATSGRPDSVEMTSFYLPKDTSKAIHISSTTTTQEVIRILLSKFHITDNPRKFALYEKSQHPNKSVTMRRMYEDETPLQICLGWTDDTINNLDNNQFVLQDYDTGEILWEAFSLPELESFLAVLNREELEYMEQVRSKYRLQKAQMLKRLKDVEKRRRSSDVGCDMMSNSKRKPIFV
jgi:Ras association domain-containing protein 1